MSAEIEQFSAQQLEEPVPTGDGKFEELFGKEASWEDDDSLVQTPRCAADADVDSLQGQVSAPADVVEADLRDIDALEALFVIGAGETKPRLPVVPGNGHLRIRATPPPTPRTVTADALKAVGKVDGQQLDLGARIARMERILFGTSLKRVAEILCDPEAEEFAVKAVLEALGTSIERYTSASKFNSRE